MAKRFTKFHSLLLREADHPADHRHSEFRCSVFRVAPIIFGAIVSDAANFCVSGLHPGQVTRLPKIPIGMTGTAVTQVPVPPPPLDGSITLNVMVWMPYFKRKLSGVKLRLAMLCPAQVVVALDADSLAAMLCRPYKILSSVSPSLALTMEILVGSRSDYRMGQTP